MAIIILSHDVKDFAYWKPIYEADVSRRTQAGFKDVAVGRKSDDPKKVYLIWEGDASNLEPMMSDPGVAELMKDAGVISAPEITVINT